MLKGSARKYLRGLAHDLKPVVQVGKEGLTGGVISAIGVALEAHELVKVRIMAERDERQEMSRAVAEKLGCECVGTIGKMAIFYREQADPEKRAIVLPDPR